MYRVIFIAKVWGGPVVVASLVYAIHRATYEAVWMPHVLTSLLVVWVLAWMCALGGRLRVAAHVLSGARWRRTGKRVVVGGGYSALLRKQALDGRPVQMPSGRVDREWWHAGTSIRHVQHRLAREGMTLSGHPSALDTTLGGWIFSNSHGSGGTLWKSSLGRLLVEEQDDQGLALRRFQVRSKKALFGDAARDQDLSRYLIRKVEVLPVPNAVTQRCAFDVHTLQDATRFLTTPSYVRLLMVTAHVATAFLWTPTDATATGGHPLMEWVWPPWLATILPGFHLPPRRWWTRRVRLRDVHVFGPSAALPLLSLPFLSFSFLYNNFEVFVSIAVTPTLLLRTVTLLHTAFRDGRLRGRCEVRCGARKLFLDFALVGTPSRAAFEVVADALGSDTRVVLHRGKYQPDTAPLRRLSEV